MTSRLFCLAGLLAATVPAFAATPIDETRPLAADGRVSVDNVKGRIVVRGWDRPEVRITGSLGDGVEKLEVEGSASALSIRVVYPEGGWFGMGGNGGEPSIVEVSVPQGAAVALESVSADVDVSGVRGALLEVDSVSGDVLVRAAQPREARFDTVSGDVDAQLDTRDLAVDAVSGDVTLAGRITGRVAIDNVSGNLRLQAGALERLTVGSVSGDATMSAALAAGGSVRAESVSGNLGLTLPAATSAKLRLDSFSGSISSPVGRVITEEYGPGSHLQASMGAGDGEIKLEAFSGNVRIETK